MSTIETKSAAILEAKVTGEPDGPGYLEGYASVKHSVDSYGDRILDGAYKHLDRLLDMGWSGFNHEGCVGMIVEAREDAKGLWVKIQFHSDADSQAVRTKIRERMDAGKMVGMSIMYRTLDANYILENEEEIRELKAIEVRECGFVLLPANEEAEVTRVKSGSGTRLNDQVKAALELIGDLEQRLGDLSEKRDNGLSDERIGQISEMSNRLAGLAEKARRDRPADPEDVKSLEELLTASGILS